MNVKIDNLNHNGVGIGRINNKVIFIPSTTIGDIVEINSYLDKGNYLETTNYKIIYYSKDRQIVKCPYYNKCGGCQIMHIPYNKQLKYKIDKVKNILEKYSNIDIIPTIEKSQEYKYRNKITFHVQNNKIGYYELKSKIFIEINNCLLISDKMNEVLSIIKENIPLDNIDNIVLKESNNELMVVFNTINNRDININNDVFNNMVSSIYINDKLIYGSSTITMNLDKYKYVVSADSFFQVNISIAHSMYNYIKGNIRSNKPRLLDLYCGTGSIGIYLADKCKYVEGIEINKDAIDNANINKKINNINNINFKCINANKINYKKGSFDVIVIDPPRSGLDKKTTHMIRNITSKYIIYVSCNPITLSRDINNLNDMYTLTNIKLFDMFPNTYHVESVALLCLKESPK